MTATPSLSLQIVIEQLKECRSMIESGFFEISDIDEKNSTFRVTMKSKIDNQEYILEVIFDNFDEWPLYLEFIDPNTGGKGTKHAYPKCNDSFFHTHPCICNPCSRKAYKDYSGVHKDSDWTLIGWKQNLKTNSLINLETILKAIYSRINNKILYVGRMA